MTHDRLYLLESQFDDLELPGRAFYCKDCMTIEGLLAAFPASAARLEVTRLPYHRPRSEIVALIGDENQNLPCLVFAEGGFVNHIEALLAALHTRHGFPERHP